MAIEVVRVGKLYRHPCMHCDTLLQFKRKDVKVEQHGKFCYEWNCGYIKCPNCGREVCVGDMAYLSRYEVK